MKKYIDDYADSILKKVKLNQEQAIEKIKLIPVDENVKPIRTEVDNIRQMVEASEIEPDDLKHKASELSLKLDERLHMAKNNSTIYDCHEFSPSIFTDRILEKVKLNQEEAIGKIKTIPADENLKPIKTIQYQTDCRSFRN